MCMFFIVKKSHLKKYCNYTEIFFREKNWKQWQKIYMGDNSTFAASTALFTSSGVPLAILHITCREGKFSMNKENKRISHFY